MNKISKQKGEKKMKLITTIYPCPDNCMKYQKPFWEPMWWSKKVIEKVHPDNHAKLIAQEWHLPSQCHLFNKP